MKTIFIRREQTHAVSAILCEGDPISHFMWASNAARVSDRSPCTEGARLRQEDIDNVLDPLKWVRFPEAQAHVIDAVQNHLVNVSGRITDVLDLPVVRAAFDGAPPPPPPKPPPTNYKIGVPKNKLP